jgi:hypothetical protein
MSGFNLPGGPLPASPWHSQLPPAPGPTGAEYNGQPALPTGWGDWTGGMVARPTEPQLNAGGHMSMPPMGSGMATGATAANPTPGYGPAQSAGAPGGFGLSNLAWANDPASFALQYAQGRGYKPGGHTRMGDFLMKLYGNIASAMFDIAPDLGKLGDPTAQMNNLLYGGGGSGFGNIAGFANQALGDLRSQLGGGQMDESQQYKFLNAYDALSNLGRNSYWQNARQNQIENALAQYNLRNAQRGAAGNPDIPADLWTFITGQVPGLAPGQ